MAVAGIAETHGCDRLVAAPGATLDDQEGLIEPKDREPRTLYGRRTEVLLDGRAIGDIVEVLPLV